MKVMFVRRLMGLSSIVPGRRGLPSVIDCMVQILWNPVAGGADVPCHSFPELARRISKLRRTEVAQSTVRSVVYQHSEWFDRVRNSEGRLCWKLSSRCRALVQNRSSVPDSPV